MRAKKLTFLFIIFSLLIHSLFILLYFYYWQPDATPVIPKLTEKKLPHAFVSSYSYKQPSASSTVKRSVDENNKNNKPQVAELKKPKEIPIKPKKDFIPTSPKESFIASSLNFLKREQTKNISTPVDDEPIYLIGDPNVPPSLLIKLLAQSLSAHFYYPEHAGKFGLKGKTIIKFTLHPNGILSDIQIIKSSEIRELDAAALYATNSAPQVHGADRILTQPKSFVVGFVFR